MMVKNGKIGELLVEPLLKEKNAILSDDDIQNLLRLAEEFKVEPSDMNLEIDY